MNKQEFKAFLERYNAGKVIVAWAESLAFDPVRCWNECERGEWLLWWAGRVPSLDRKVLVKAAVEVAATALPYTNDERAHKCIEVTRLWCEGKATDEEIEVAARAAGAASAAAADAAVEAFLRDDLDVVPGSDAAWAAWAAEVAARAAEVAARAAAWAARAAVRASTHKQHADIVRSIIPIEAVLKGGDRE